MTTVVATGSILSTDGWQGYVSLRDRHDHRLVNVGPADNQGEQHVKDAAHIHRVFSNLKT